jgi:hypothetical protein
MGPVTTIRGGCLCRAVGYRIDGPVSRMSHCHCSMCRKAHGSAVGTYVEALATDFAWTRGEDALGRHVSSPGVTRSFCSRCGSPLQWLSARRAQHVGIAAGSLDDDPGIRPSMHLYTDSRAPWDTLPDDGLPRHPAGSGG